MSTNSSRYSTVSQRTKSTVVRGSFFLSAAALFPGLACGASDADVLASATTTSDQTTEATNESTTLPTDATETTMAADAGDAGIPVADTAQLQIDFSFEAQGDRVRNPYVAVWIEDADGALVDTVAVWHLQSEKGNKWIDDLKRWYSVSDNGSNGEEISSATRSPGDYSLLWGATDTAGAKVQTGDYFICIEAAREHGPYELIREPIALGSDGFTLELPAANELVNASVSFSA